jgi:hypothetical protein
MIQAGERWRTAIQEQLKAASVAILLVSRYFFATDFISRNELPPLLEAAAKDGVTIFWIAVSASSYQRSPISEYQSANDPSRPLHSLSPAELSRELVQIANRVQHAVSSRRTP